MTAMLPSRPPGEDRATPAGEVVDPDTVLTRPAVGEAGPVFDELDIARLRLLCDLRKEMALPTTAMPVVLNLIDQLYQTRRDLRTLLRALDDQPEDVRSTLAARLRLSDTNDAAEDSD